MSIRIYREQATINVLPFLICPTAFTDQEANMVIGFSELKENTDEIVKKLIGFAEGFLCPIIAVVLWYREKIIAANVINSEVKDIRSGRKGLKLIYGFAIRRNVLGKRLNIFSRAFDMFHIYMAYEFGIDDLSLDSMDIIISKFQAINTNPDELITKDNLGWFLQGLESDSFVEIVEKSIILRALSKNMNRYKNSKLICRRPCGNLNSTASFWADLDRELPISLKL